MVEEERVVRGEKEMKSIPDTSVFGENRDLHRGEEDNREEERVAIFRLLSLPLLLVEYSNKTHKRCGETIYLRVHKKGPKFLIFVFNHMIKKICFLTAVYLKTLFH